MRKKVSTLTEILLPVVLLLLLAMGFFLAEIELIPSQSYNNERWSNYIIFAQNDSEVNDIRITNPSYSFECLNVPDLALGVVNSLVVPPNSTDTGLTSLTASSSLLDALNSVDSSSGSGEIDPLEVIINSACSIITPDNPLLTEDNAELVSNICGLLNSDVLNSDATRFLICLTNPLNLSDVALSLICDQDSGDDSTGGIGAGIGVTDFLSEAAAGILIGSLNTTYIIDEIACPNNSIGDDGIFLASVDANEFCLTEKDDVTTDNIFDSINRAALTTTTCSNQTVLINATESLVTLCNSLNALETVEAVTDFADPDNLNPLLDSITISDALALIGISPNSSICIDINNILNYYGPLQIPDFNTFVTVSQIFSPLSTQSGILDDGLLRQLVTFSDFATLFNLGELVFAAKDKSLKAEVQNVVNYCNSTSTVFDSVYYNSIFDSEEAAINFALDRALNINQVWAVVVFNDISSDGSIFDYTIRMNYTAAPTTRRSAVRSWQRGLSSLFRGYYSSGFLSVQTLLDGYQVSRIQSLFPGSDDNANILLTSLPTHIPFPTRGYERNTFYESASGLLGFIITLCILLPVARMIKCLVEEKESRMKETLKIMGMQSIPYNLSWITTYAVIFAIIGAASTIILKLSFFQFTDIFVIIILYVLFFICVIGFCFMVSAFFNKSKLAGIIAPMVLLAAVLPRYIFFTSEEAELLTEKLFACLLAPTAFAFGCDLITEFESYGVGAQFDNLGSEDGLTVSLVFVMLAVDSVLYMVLGLLINKLIPSEYGQNSNIISSISRGFKQKIKTLCSQCLVKSLSLVDSSYHMKQNETKTVDGVDADENESKHDNNTGDIEKVSNQLKDFESIALKNLVKIYSNGKRAVNGFNLTIYQNQITALLGHNGAGKSTIVSMLTGLLESTSGEISIQGLNASTHMPEIRKSLGICPQSNVIFPFMSVREHLDLLAAVKGVPVLQVKSAVEEMIKKVGLIEKQHTFAAGLSGGQKRRLCVAMALIGGSEVIFLDEPSSGLDPQARRDMWDLLKTSKSGRTIVFTTHFMDEADLLGDRIAIVSEGRLRCAGSSLFLKSRYGIGYNLTICLQNTQFLDSDSLSLDSNGSNNNKFTVAATKYSNLRYVVLTMVPGSILLNSNGGEMTFQLPLSSVSVFGELFKFLENNDESLCIQSYGMSMTTLEEVFIKLAHESTNDKNTTINLNKNLVGALEESKEEPPSTYGVDTAVLEALYLSERSSDDIADSHQVEVQEKVQELLISKEDISKYLIDNFLSHTPIDSLFGCGVIENIRSDGVYVVQLSYGKAYLQYSGFRIAKPTISDNVIEISTKDILRTTHTEELKSNDIILDIMEHSSHVDFTSDTQQEKKKQEHKRTAEWSKSYPPAGLGKQWQQLLRKRFLNSKRDVQGFCCQIFIPVVIVSVVLLILTIQFNWSGDPRVLDLDLYTGLLSDGSTPSLEGYAPPTSVPYLYNEATTNLATALLESETKAKLRITPITGLDSNDINNYLIENPYHEYSRLSGFALNDTIEDTGGDFTIYHNTSAFDAVPSLWNSLKRSSLIKYIEESSTDGGAVDASTKEDVLRNFKYRVTTHPLPLTGREIQITESILNVIAAMFLLIPFCFVSSNFVVFLVKERAVKAKHLQLTSGVNLTSFWMANFIYDMFMYCIVVLCSMIVFLLHGSSTFVGTPLRILATILMLFMFGVATLPLSYILSFFFVEAGSAQIMIGMVNFILGFAVVVANFILDGIESTQDINAELKFFYRLFPQFNFGEGLISMSDTFLGTNTDPFEWEVTGRNLTYMALEAVVCFILTLLIDYGFFKRSFRAVTHLRNQIFLKVSNIINHGTVNMSSGTAVVDHYAGDIELNKLPHSTTSDANPLGLDDDVWRESQYIDHLVKQSNANTTNSNTDNNNNNTATSMASVMQVEKKSLVLHRLRKVFPGRRALGDPAKVAVNDLSFSVGKGRIFGFLGVNGAGKSTTISILVNDLESSSGNAWVDGKSVITNFKDVRHELGFCPQFDPIFENLTAREHLEFYGVLKGIPNSSLTAAVNDLIELVGLSPFKNRCAGTYSGGNKRKLSLAIALIGGSEVIFLDEPSSGLDPQARRDMWDVVEGAIHGDISAVLTTHSMEEAEALCDDIGILASGSLVALGTSQHLKNKFGKGYYIEISADIDRFIEIKSYMTHTFPGIALAEEFDTRLKYCVSSENLNLSYIFESIEHQKSKLGVRDYSVSQSSLEGIFIDLIKNKNLD